MSYRVKWRSKVLQDLRKFPKVVSKRIVRKVDLIKDNPMHYLEKLVDDPGFKIRVGDYRVIIDLIENENLLFVRVVGHRRNIYKRNL